MRSRRNRIVVAGLLAFTVLLILGYLLIDRIPDVGANDLAWQDPDLVPVLEARLGIGNAEDLSISPDGETAVVRTENGLFAYRLSTLKPLWVSAREDVPAILGWSPEGRLLVGRSSQGELTIRDGQTGVDLATMEGDASELDDFPILNRFSLSADGQILAAGTYGAEWIWLWDAQTGERKARLSGVGTSGLTSLAWSPDSKQLASGWAGGGIVLWDVSSGRELRWPEGHSGDVRLLAFSPNGAWLASVSDDFTGIVWDARTGDQLRQFAHAWIGALAWSPDSRLLAFDSSDSSAGVTVQDVLTGQEMLVLARRGTGVMDGTLGLSWSPDGKELIAATYHEPIVVWDARTGEQLRSLGGHEGKVHDVAWSPDGRQLAAASDGGTVIVWDRDGRRQRAISDPSGRAYSVAWSPDARHLASGGAGRLTVWDAQDLEPVRSFPAEAPLVEGEGPRVEPITWSQNGGLVAFREWGDGRTQGWVIRDGSHPLTFEGGSVTWSSDGSLQANQTSRRPEFVRIWDTLSGQLVLEKDGLVNGVWSPVGSRMASVSGDPGRDQVLVVWDARSGQIVCQASPGTGLGWNFNSTAWSPNGELLVTATVNDVVSIWDATRCQMVQQWLGHDDWISAVAWSPDGKQIATASWDGTVKLWGVGPARAGLSMPPSLAHGPTLTAIAGPTSTARAGIVPQATAPSSPTPTEERPATPAGPTIARLSPGTPVTITEIHMYRSGLRGWALGGTDGAADHVLRTYDGGETWRDLTPPQPVSPGGPQNARAFFHPFQSTVAWVVYQDDDPPDPPAMAWTTDDGGKTWTAIQLPVPLLPTAQGIVFSTADTSVWFISTTRNPDGATSIDLFLSRNGGQDWVGSPSERLSDFFLTEAAELAAEYGDSAHLAGTQGCEDCPVLMQTYDGGFSWQEEEIPPPPRELPWGTICRASNLVSLPGRIAFRLICSEGNDAPRVSFLYTSFGGAEWTVIPDPYLEGSLVFTDSETGYLLGRHIFRTNDGGHSWAHVKAVTWAGQFTFANPTDGWAVARSTEAIALVQTTDGGRTWKELNPVIADATSAGPEIPQPEDRAAICSPTPSQSRPGWWTCASDLYGFAFEYPASFDDPPVGPISLGEEADYFDMQIGVSLGEEVCPPDHLIGQYIEQEPAYVGDHEWRRGEWNEGAAGRTYYTFDFLTYQEQTCVSFSFVTAVSNEGPFQYPRLPAALMEILSSFRWLEGEG